MTLGSRGTQTIAGDDGLELCVEAFGRRTDPALLLIGGGPGQWTGGRTNCAAGWPAEDAWSSVTTSATRAHRPATRQALPATPPPTSSRTRFECWTASVSGVRTWWACR